MTERFPLSRRSLLHAAAALAGGLASPIASAQTTRRSALVTLFFRGGYNALFGNADVFAPAGTFGVAGANQESLGNGLVVDKATLGSLPAIAKQNMASIGVRHGLTAHVAARTADWT